MTLTRRSLIRRGAAAAAAGALHGALVTADVALAQETERTAALARLTELEQAAELAYSLAAEDGNLPDRVSQTFEEFSLHSGERATALSEALDQLGVEPPQPSDDAATYDSLEGYDSGDGAARQLRFLGSLESDLIAAYGEEVGALEPGDLTRTAAQIAGSHAQQLVALRLLAAVPGDAITDIPQAEPNTAG